MFNIPAETWNEEVVETIRRRLPFRGRVRERGRWRHPFRHSLRYDYDDGEWRYQVRPGFVNGKPVDVTTAHDLISDRTKLRLEPDNEAEDYAGNVRRDELTDSLRGKKTPPPVAYLTEYPDIRVPGLRNIGLGSTPTGIASDSSGRPVASYEKVPEFFVERGVLELTPENVNNILAGELPADRRLLRAFDTWITHDRLQAKVEWNYGIVLDATVAHFNVLYTRDTPANNHAYMDHGSEYVPQPSPETYFNSVLSGAVDDNDRDELKMATIYFLSQPGEELISPTDYSWEAFVKHDVFYNLNYAGRNPLPPVANEPITLLTGLAAGIGNPVIGAILASNNDMSNAARQAYNSRSLEGRFWTI